MRRREFIRLVVGAAAAWPLAARAQQPAMPRKIGVLMSSVDNPATHPWIVAFRQRLEELGWSEKRNIRIDYRGGSIERLPQSVQELLASGPEVVIVTSTPSLAAVRRAGATAAIVFANVTDPVGQGFVASLAKPGGNITGFMNFEASIAGKWVEMLREISPSLFGVAVIFNPQLGPQTEYYIPAIEAAAHKLSLRAAITRVHSDSELDSAFAELGREVGIGLIVPPGVNSTAFHNKVIAAADRYRVPAMYWSRDYVGEGGLVAYGTDETDLLRGAAGYTDRILRGEKPGELPVQAPTKFELVINLKTAKALGLTVPLTLQAAADEVIE